MKTAFSFLAFLLTMFCAATAFAADTVAQSPKDVLIAAGATFVAAILLALAKRLFDKMGIDTTAAQDARLRDLIEGGILLAEEIAEAEIKGKVAKGVPPEHAKFDIDKLAVAAQFVVKHAPKKLGFLNGISFDKAVDKVRAELPRMGIRLADPKFGSLPKRFPNLGGIPRF